MGNKIGVTAVAEGIVVGVRLGLLALIAVGVGVYVGVTELPVARSWMLCC